MDRWANGRSGLSRVAGRVGLVGRVLICGPGIALALAGCAREEAPDAYGNVEAVEVVVSPTIGGRLVSFSVEEGQKLAADAVVASIDAVELGLERDQLTAQQAAGTSRVAEVGRQIEVLEAQRAVAQAQRDAAAAQQSVLAAQVDIARRNRERTDRLFAQQAATAQQRDQAERDLRVLEEQIKAQAEQVEAQTRQVNAQGAQIAMARAQRDTAAQQVKSAEAQVARATERVSKAEVKNPTDGTVLATYARAGETVAPGQPLYRIANMTEVDVRAYISEPQLAQVKVGQQAQVSFDSGEERQSVSGTVTWIASRAEFTPTPIQTREERADLVYAIKLRVANADDRLKIGMPVDVDFGNGQ